MVGPFALVGSGVAVGAMAVVCYDHLTGCRGGHVWDEWEATDRWKVTPFGHRDSVGLEREHERRCRRDECGATETEYQREVNEAYAASMEEVLDGVTEVRYQCPSCFEEVADSERETTWRGHPSGVGRHRYEQCPHCGTRSDCANWTRFDWGDVE